MEGGEERRMEGGGGEKDRQIDRRFFLNKKVEGVEERKKVVGQGIRKQEEKNKMYFDIQFFFYICISVFWFFMGFIWGGLGLFGIFSWLVFFYLEIVYLQ